MSHHGSLLWSVSETLKRTHDIHQLSNLLLSTQYESVSAASILPENHQYVPVKTGNPAPLSGDTLFLSPHPSDSSADFFPIFMRKLKDLGCGCRQLVLTRGEKGLSEDETDLAKVIRVRRAEEAGSAEHVGVKTRYLTRNGELIDHFTDPRFEDPESELFFPDGELMPNIRELTDCLKREIAAKPPARLAIPAFYADHPDHLATAIAAVNALIELEKDGFFQTHAPIEVFTSDPEFAVATGQSWALDNTPSTYGGRGEAVDPELVQPISYGWVKDPETGLIFPSNDIREAGNVTFDEPFATPPFILSVSEEEERFKMTALGHHSTQIEGKDYAALIPAANLFMGTRLPESDEWGIGVFPVNIPGVTPQSSAMLAAMPDGTVYQLCDANTGTCVEQALIR